ncbi:hypothetical protein J2045_004514 [Peteryoungia aggregata LMG 23059]|uniref:Transmembrane protein n=1 Tax=Peteryoungia aggregata LMG 23059 TaxID=1368425 RepID=A0ABU0GDP5_9HYPH|nr:hypothetical protein [Peteryoungia aggregata]MDQ0423462.1 hypothetical protein [Peteryoungia aggregata LMG 23059]
MDYELDDFSPSSRRSRSIAWLALLSGVALIMIAVGSPQATPASGIGPTSLRASPLPPQADPAFTSSIIPSAVALEAPSPTAAIKHEATLPLRERHILIVLLLVCFTAMAAGGAALWKRGWRELVQRDHSTSAS